MANVRLQITAKVWYLDVDGSTPLGTHTSTTDWFADDGLFDATEGLSEKELMDLAAHVDKLHEDELTPVARDSVPTLLGQSAGTMAFVKAISRLRVRATEIRADLLPQLRADLQYDSSEAPLPEPPVAPDPEEWES